MLIFNTILPTNKFFIKYIEFNNENNSSALMVRSNQTITDNLCHGADQARNIKNNKASETSSTATEQTDRTGSSILKWIVDRTVSNTSLAAAAAAAAASSSSNTTTAVTNLQKSPSTSKNTSQSQFESSNSNAQSTSSNLNNIASKQSSSLIERIKKKVSETKMIDKVSICSSNYDDYDLNNLNNGGGSIGAGKLEGEETTSLNYDEISQFSQNTYDNSSLNSKQDLYIHNEVKEEEVMEEQNAANPCQINKEVIDRKMHSACSKVEYDSVDSSSSPSISSASSSSSSLYSSKKSSIYLSYDDSESSHSSSSSLASSLMTSLSIRSSDSPRHSCCSYSSSKSSVNSFSSSSNFSDCDENEFLNDKKLRKTSVNSLKDNDEAALKHLEHRYLKYNKEKSKEKKKRKLFLKFSKKRASLNSTKSGLLEKVAERPPEKSSSLNPDDITDAKEEVSFC
jgi:hypothetical protein